MQTQSCRGNMGLKDQVHALRWIRDNIRQFRGDPANVTISGHGAGATCVNFHLISPMSAGKLTKVSTIMFTRSMLRGLEIPYNHFQVSSTRRSYRPAAFTARGVSRGIGENSKS